MAGHPQSHDSTVREGLAPLRFCLLEASILRRCLGINTGVQCLLQRSSATCLIFFRVLTQC